MWLIILLTIIVVVGFAFLVDRRNKQINNTNQNKINSNSKPGESSNYLMGDNRYMNGG